MSYSFLFLLLISDLENAKIIGILGIGSKITIKTCGHLFWLPSKMILPVSSDSNHLNKQRLRDTLIFSWPNFHFISGLRYRNYLNLICIMYYLITSLLTT